jgi:hypothetical protein
VLPEGEGRLGTAGLVIQATGANLRAETTRQLLDRAARESGLTFLAGSRKGQPIQRWSDLEEFQKNQVEKQEPLASELTLRGETAVIRGSEGAIRRARTNELQQDSLVDQRGDDLKLNARNIDGKEWRDNRNDRRQILHAKKEEVYQGVKFSEGEKDARDRYFATIAEAKANQNNVMNTAAWEEVDIWLSEQTPEDQAFIERSSGQGEATIVEREYLNAVKALRPYWDLPEHPRVRIRFRKENPTLDAFLVRWGYVTKPETPEGYDEFRKLAQPATLSTPQPTPQPTQTAPGDEAQRINGLEELRRIMGPGQLIGAGR